METPKSGCTTFVQTILLHTSEVAGLFTKSRLPSGTFVQTELKSQGEQRDCHRHGVTDGHISLVPFRIVTWAARKQYITSSGLGTTEDIGYYDYRPVTLLFACFISFQRYALS